MVINPVMTDDRNQGQSGVNNPMYGSGDGMGATDALYDTAVQSHTTIANGTYVGMAPEDGDALYDMADSSVAPVKNPYAGRDSMALTAQDMALYDDAGPTNAQSLYDIAGADTDNKTGTMNSLRGFSSFKSDATRDRTSTVWNTDAQPDALYDMAAGVQQQSPYDMAGAEQTQPSPYSMLAAEHVGGGYAPSGVQTPALYDAAGAETSTAPRGRAGLSSYEEAATFDTEGGSDLYDATTTTIDYGPSQAKQQQSNYDVAAGDTSPQLGVYDVADSNPISANTLYDAAAATGPNAADPTVQGWLNVARTTKQDKKAVKQMLKDAGAQYGLGCYCFRDSSKANSIVLCVLVAKTEVANIRMEESPGGSVLVHDLTSEPMPFADMTAVLQYVICTMLHLPLSLHLANLLLAR